MNFCYKWPGLCVSGGESQVRSSTPWGTGPQPHPQPPPLLWPPSSRLCCWASSVHLTDCVTVTVWADCPRAQACRSDEPLMPADLQVSLGASSPLLAAGVLLLRLGCSTHPMSTRHTDPLLPGACAECLVFPRAQRLPHTGR